MDCNNRNQQHAHDHGDGCGHTAIQHEGQTAYLHDGQMHVRHGDHYDDAAVSIGDRNPQRCTPTHACDGHPAQHQHGPDCGHPQVPHGDHTDYLVHDHLHHPHEGHCDHHGAVIVEERSRKVA